MSTTSQFDIPLLASSQAQKEVTVNEALTRIDHALNLSVIDRDLATPPTSPAEGDAYLVAASATDIWTGHEGEIAYFNQIWRFISAKAGMKLWVKDEAVYLSYDGSAWVVQNAGSSGVGTLRPKKLVVIGDSILGNGAQASDLGSILDQRGLVTWMQIHLGFPFTFNIHHDGANEQGQDAAIGGDTVANMAARFAADVLAQNPDIVLVQGGTNDITAGSDVPTITGHLKSMIDAALAQGVIVAVMPILPRSDVESRLHGGSDKNWTTDQRAVHHGVNRWLRRYAHETNNVILIDPYRDLLDAAHADGNALDAMTYDGLHPSPQAGFLIGKRAAEAVSSLVSSQQHLTLSQSDAYDATHNPYGNILQNGTLQGTAGTLGSGVSGSMPNYFNLSRFNGSHMTVAVSRVARSDEFSGEQVQLLCSVNGLGSSDGRFRFRNITPSTITNVIDGAWYEASCEVEVFASANGTSPLTGLYLELRDMSSGGRYARCLNSEYEYTPPNPNAVYPLPDVAWKGVLKTPALQLSGTTGLRYYFFIQMDEAKTDSVEIRVSNFAIHQLPAAPDL